MNKPVNFLNEIIPASAGTGKTYRLTNKFIQLMHQGVKPESIVALTFTKKAAAEFFEEIMEVTKKGSCIDITTAEFHRHQVNFSIDKKWFCTP